MVCKFCGSTISIFNKFHTVDCCKSCFDDGLTYKRRKNMAIKGGAKQKVLNYLITNFAVEIGYKADKTKYNKAWHKLWVNIHRIGLFKDDSKSNRSK